jgi:hypothetical protein
VFIHVTGPSRNAFLTIGAPTLLWGVIAIGLDTSRLVEIQPLSMDLLWSEFGTGQFLTVGVITLAGLLFTVLGLRGRFEVHTVRKGIALTCCIQLLAAMSVVCGVEIQQYWRVGSTIPVTLRGYCATLPGDDGKLINPVLWRDARTNTNWYPIATQKQLQDNVMQGGFPTGSQLTMTFVSNDRAIIIGKDSAVPVVLHREPGLWPYLRFVRAQSDPVPFNCA